jgi:hypothetical protein
MDSDSKLSSTNISQSNARDASKVIPTHAVSIRLANQPKLGDTCVVKEDQFISVDHSPSHENGSKISDIWGHGLNSDYLKILGDSLSSKMPGHYASP